MLIGALWSILPAYFANSSAVLWGGGVPVDLGRDFVDGRRLLGDGKTLNGLAGGVGTGVAAALALNLLAPAPGMPAFSPLAALGLSLGALLGDLAASFLKRRLSLERGRMAPGLDQLDFLAGALLLSYAFDPGWFLGVFDAASLLFVAVATPVVHVSVNLFAYKAGLKGEPW